MADQAPKFMEPNNEAKSSVGGSAPSNGKPGPQDPKSSSPRPNTVVESMGDVPGSSPNKPASKSMR